jgi:GNAT superfamily N-acetyltransferase
MTPLSDDAVALSLSQFGEAWRVICSPSPNYALEADEGIEYIFSGIPIGFFNIALITHRGVTSEELAAYARRACAWVPTESVPWFLVVTHETLAVGVDAVSILDGCGFGTVMPLTGMVAHQIAPATRGIADLQLTVPQDDADLAAILDVNALAYGTGLDEGKPIVGTRSFWEGHVPVLGSVGGKVASCAAVLMVHGHRYVALVATDPATQRRGYAEATMRHALETAARIHGDVPTVLHATAAGRPIYERMGYAAISNHTLFMQKKFLGAH